MKNACFFLLFFAATALIGCGKSDPNHQPDGEAKYQITVGVQPGDGANAADAAAEVQHLLTKRLRQMEVKYQSIDFDEAKKILTFKLINLPDGVDFETFQSQFLERATLGFAPAKRFNDPEMAPFVELLRTDSMVALGFVGNDGAGVPAVFGWSKTADTRTLDSALSNPVFQAALPENTGLAWGKSGSWSRDAGGYGNALELFCFRVKNGGAYEITEQNLIECVASPDPSTGTLLISLGFDQQGSNIWSKMTQQAAENGNREIAIVLNGMVISAPAVISPILNGKSAISGGWSASDFKEVVALETRLEIAMLPHKIQLIDAVMR